MSEFLDAYDQQILASLDTERWLRPLDIGGHSRSVHSRRLLRLVKWGYVEKKARTSHCSRPSYLYRRVTKGASE